CRSSSPGLNNQGARIVPDGGLQPGGDDLASVGTTQERGMQSAESRRKLVARLEREAEESPARYRLKLALLAALGYAVLLTALALTLGLLVSIVLYMLIVRPPV